MILHFRGIFMKALSLILLAFFLAACVPTSTSEPERNEQITKAPALPTKPSNLPDLGVAPELNNEVWLNTDEPLRLANLKGQVVLLDMWTFG